MQGCVGLSFIFWQNFFLWTGWKDDFQCREAVTAVQCTVPVVRTVHGHRYSLQLVTWSLHKRQRAFLKASNWNTTTDTPLPGIVKSVISSIFAWNIWLHWSCGLADFVFRKYFLNSHLANTLYWKLHSRVLVKSFISWEYRWNQRLH